MNRINPLYILALAFVMLLLSINLSSKEQAQLNKNNSNYLERLLKAKEYQLLKSNHQGRAQVLSRLEGIASNEEFKKAGLLVNKRKASWQFVFTNEKKELLQRFFNRILQDRFTIKKMQLFDKKIVIEVEI